MDVNMNKELRDYLRKKSVEKDPTVTDTFYLFIYLSLYDEKNSTILSSWSAFETSR